MNPNSHYNREDCTLLDFDCPYDIIPCAVPRDWQLLERETSRYWSVESDVSETAKAVEDTQTGLLQIVFDEVSSGGSGSESCGGTSRITCTVKNTFPGDPTQLEGICREDFSGSCTNDLEVNEGAEPADIPMTCFSVSRVNFTLQSED